MSRKRIENLNERALMKGRLKMKAHEDFYFRADGIKIAGKEDDVKECIDCHIIFPSTAFTTRSTRGDGAYYLQGRCRECSTKTELERRQVKKNAPPKPERCDCCHKKGVSFVSLRDKHKKVELQIDHIHGTSLFRGWICRKCNTGMGHLGDTLEGVLQAAIYMEPDIEKIIETLHKVYDEMFARTSEKK
tara:strand:- start:77 stop:643 length:567 start_codon:yes stop_codon:yes gene_type:complete